MERANVSYKHITLLIRKYHSHDLSFNLNLFSNLNPSVTHWKRSRRKARVSNGQQSNETKSLLELINQADIGKEREKRKIVTDLLDAIFAVMKYITFALVNFMMGRYFDMLRNFVHIRQVISQYLNTIWIVVAKPLWNIEKKQVKLGYMLTIKILFCYSHHWWS